MTQPAQTEPHTRREEAFIDYLTSLTERRRRKQLAALRRGLGEPPGTVSACYPVVAPWTRGLSLRHERLYYLVASLYALHPSGGRGSLGTTARRVAEAGGEESTERRLLVLLDADDEGLTTYLRGFVGLAKAHDVGVDYLRLLDDLRFWNAASHTVQRRWARDFYAPERSRDESD